MTTKSERRHWQSSTRIHAAQAKAMEKMPRTNKKARRVSSLPFVFVSCVPEPADHAQALVGLHCRTANQTVKFRSRRNCRHGTALSRDGSQWTRGANADEWPLGLPRSSRLLLPKSRSLQQRCANTLMKVPPFDFERENEVSMDCLRGGTKYMEEAWQKSTIDRGSNGAASQEKTPRAILTRSSNRVLKCKEASEQMRQHQHMRWKRVLEGLVHLPRELGAGRLA